MADIKLDPTELAAFAEVGSRGDYYREAVRDRAAQQVNETGRTSEITSDGGQLVDAVMAPVPATSGTSVADVVPPSDFISVVGEAPGADPDPKKLWPAKDVAGT